MRNLFSVGPTDRRLGRTTTTTTTTRRGEQEEDEEEEKQTKGNWMDGCCRNKFCFCGLRLSRIFCQINCHPLLFSFFVLRFCTRLSWFWTCFVHSSSSSSKEAPRLAFRLPGPPPLQVVAGRLLVGLLQESRNLSNFLSPWGGRIDWKTVGLRTYNGPILFWKCELGGSLRLLI
jgi:hypothetical protein